MSRMDGINNRCEASALDSLHSYQLRGMKPQPWIAFIHISYVKYGITGVKPQPWIAFIHVRYVKDGMTGGTLCPNNGSVHVSINQLFFA
jgi:hypothetical protein